MNNIDIDIDKINTDIIESLSNKFTKENIYYKFEDFLARTFEELNPENKVYQRVLATEEDLLEGFEEGDIVFDKLEFKKASIFFFKELESKFKKDFEKMDSFLEKRYLEDNKNNTNILKSTALFFYLTNSK